MNVVDTQLGLDLEAKRFTAKSASAPPPAIIIHLLSRAHMVARKAVNIVRIMAKSPMNIFLGDLH